MVMSVESQLEQPLLLNLSRSRRELLRVRTNPLTEIVLDNSGNVRSSKTIATNNYQFVLLAPLSSESATLVESGVK